MVLQSKYNGLLLILLLSSVIVFAGCTAQPIKNNVVNTTEDYQINDTFQVRPLIEKSTIDDSYDNISYDYESANNSLLINRTNSTIFLSGKKEIKLRVPLYHSINRTLGRMARYDLPILRPSPIRTGDNQFRGYDQFLWLNGSIMLTSNNDRVDSALITEKNTPLMAYKLSLQGMFFWDNRIIGSNIRILGADYMVMSATNNSLRLNGINIPQYLVIRDGKSLESNRKRISNSRTYYDGKGFYYLLRAESKESTDQYSGIIVWPGESLKDKISHEEALMSPYFNIRYEGLEDIPEDMMFHIEIHNYGRRVSLRVGNYEVPLMYADNGTLKLGDGKHRMHLIEDGPIKEDEFILLHNKGLSALNIMKVSGIDVKERKVTFKDLNSNTISVDWDEKTRDAYLPFLDKQYRIEFINGSTNETFNDNAIFMDLDGNGVIRRQIRLTDIDHVLGDIMLSPNLRVLITELSGQANLTIETSPFNYGQHKSVTGIINKEKIVVQVEVSGDKLILKIPEDIGSLRKQELIPGPDNKEYYLLTPWGSLISKDDGIEGDIHIELPLIQRMGIIAFSNNN